MTTLFVTSTGTDIGKTHLCCQLITAWRSNLRIRCIKPVVTGFDPAAPESSDTARLLDAQQLPLDRNRIGATSPWRYRAPLAADMAARRENTAVPFDELVAFSASPPDIDVNLIEGIGGVMAPIDTSHTVLDWIAALETSVLLVVGSYLGSLSHTLTAVDVLQRCERRPIAIVISASLNEPVSTDETASTLKRFCGDLPIAILPRAPAATAASATTAAATPAATSAATPAATSAATSVATTAATPAATSVATRVMQLLNPG
jgi:dethiobiotin synthetase